jgi:DNA-binding XRE family transcriptional regulator
MARQKLVRMRRKAMMTQEDAAYRAGISRTSLARYETGAQAPGVAACRSLAKLYDVTFEEIIEAVESNGTGELPVLNGGWWSNYEAFEQSAVRIRTWEPMVVPGLLQVEAYSRALAGDNDELVERRMARRAIVTRPDDPVELTAIIDESVLFRPVGGSIALAAQLDHLANMAERPNVTVHVLPLSAPEKAVAIGGKGAFVILEPCWPGGMVHQEYEGGSHILHSYHDLQTLTTAFEDLAEMAFTPAESLALIRTHTKELQQ